MHSQSHETFSLLHSRGLPQQYQTLYEIHITILSMFTTAPAVKEVNHNLAASFSMPLSATAQTPGGVDKPMVWSHDSASVR